MKVTRIVTALCALGFPFGVLLVANGCGHKDTDAAPATTAAPAPTPTPTPTPAATMMPEEDAGADAPADADADAPKVGGADPTGVRACCAALAQNANSAPLDQKPMLIQAAAICNGLVNNPQGRAGLAAVRGVLAGAKMPSSCK